MKIKVIDMPYEQVQALPEERYRPPVYQNRFFRWLLKTISRRELKKVHFTLTKTGLGHLEQDQPCLVLMNHSCFLDLAIASSVLYPRQFHVICTLDGFIGKDRLMRSIGCIPTKKFITDLTLVKDMLYAVNELKSDILLFPEASYSFDGTATPLPESLGKALKILKVPVVMIRTYGAYLRDPLYNNLQLRDVAVSAGMQLLLTKKDIEEKSPAELNSILKEQFTFDNFKWQQENNIRISEPFRADGLHRVLYKCPVCRSEGETIGKGTSLTCRRCSSQWTLTEYGRLEKTYGPESPPCSADLTDPDAPEAPKDLTHIPDWYAWERAYVRHEIERGSYRMEFPAEIMVLKDTKAVYHVGEGNLIHSCDGFELTGCDGKLSYHQSAKASYSLYSDYYWYEIGDMISIGTMKIQYYCFPKDTTFKALNGGAWKPGTAIVAKARLAAEEMHKLYSRKHSDFDI